MSKNKTIAIIILAVLAVVATSVWFAMSPEKEPATQIAQAKAALTVSVKEPEQVTLPVSLTANGNIEAWQEAIIGSELNGQRLTEVNVNVGDVVREGQVLARFAPETLKADLMQAQANVSEAEAAAEEAKANAQRARALDKTGALSSQEVSRFVAAEQTANARLAAAKAALESQQVRNRNLLVLAPDSGIISDRKATVGLVVNAGTELFRLIRKGRLEWRAEVTSSEAGKISPGTPVKMTAVNGAVLDGKVRVIAPTVNPKNRTTLVYVDLATRNGKTMPVQAGMFTSGEFLLGDTTALVVPEQAIVMRDGFQYVFRLNPDNRVAQTKVKPGRRLGNQVEILDGIPPETKLVVSGAGFLNDGDLVKTADLAQSQQPPAVSPAASRQGPQAVKQAGRS